MFAIAALTAACGGTPSSPPPRPAPTTTAEAAPPALEKVAVTVPDELKEGPFETQQYAEVPPGWKIAVWARIPGVRFPAWAQDGGLLLTSPADGQVLRAVNDPSGKARVDVVLDNLNQPLGIAFDGRTVYVAESDTITSYDYEQGKLVNPRPVAKNLPDAKSADLGGTYAHALKNVVVGPDRSLYYSVGSTGNISVEDRDATPQRAVIMRIPPTPGAAPEVFARGVRNGTGLAIAPDGAVWTAVNHRDNILYPHDRSYEGNGGSSRGQLIDAYLANHPAEQLAKLTAGRDLGWPFCNSDPDVNPGAPDTAFDYTTPAFVNDVELNPDGTKLDCSSLTPVEQSFPAHSAPLGITFVTVPGPYGQGALVGLHGSWNANPPRAPEVSFFPYKNGQLGKQQTLVGGFQNADGSRWGRPVAATVGPDDAVYVTDDTAAAVYRLTPPGVR
ncbi:gluconolaconase [Actinomycetes bacterium KLBMP 9759]